jgi:hypothetical protein
MGIFDEELLARSARQARQHSSGLQCFEFKHQPCGTFCDSCACRHSRNTIWRTKSSDRKRFAERTLPLGRLFQHQRGSDG